MTSAAIRNALLTWPRATLTVMPLTLPRVVVVLAAALAGSAGSAVPTGPTGPGRPARARTSARRPAWRIPPRSRLPRRSGPVRRPAPWYRPFDPGPEGQCGQGRRPADGG